MYIQTWHRKKRLDEDTQITRAAMPLSGTAMAFLWQSLFSPFSVFAKFVKTFYRSTITVCLVTDLEGTRL